MDTTAVTTEIAAAVPAIEAIGAAILAVAVVIMIFKMGKSLIRS